MNELGLFLHLDRVVLTVRDRILTEILEETEQFKRSGWVLGGLVLHDQARGVRRRHRISGVFRRPLARDRAFIVRHLVSAIVVVAKLF